MKCFVLKKSFLISLFLTLYVLANGQIYKTNKSHVDFTSDAPLELIQASSDQLKGLLNTSDKSFAFQVSMKSFNGFNSSMQKTHFNENYLETEKYPNAIFSGKIIEDIDFNKPGTYNVRGKGNFSVHGVEQIRIIKCTLVVKKGSVSINSSFSVYLDDHNIKIPSIVNQKIAEEITVNIKTNLSLNE